MLLGICLNVALEVDVIAFLDVIRTQCRAQREGDLRGVCVRERERECINLYTINVIFNCIF